MILWIEKPLALAMHDRQLAEHGGSTGIRDEALPESALARPRHTHAYSEPPADLATLAASLAYGLAKNHPFVDGNKRVTASACETFLMLNGVVLTADDAPLYAQYLGITDGSISEEEFAAWLRDNLHVRGGNTVNEPTAEYDPAAG